jgi:membrane protein YqaA with SNARE-associated domain
MEKFVGWIQSVALGLGAPGLFLVALCDSSFISLPEVVDILLVWMVTQHRSRVLVYSASATIGSVLGCLSLYYVGRKGDQFIQRRVSAQRVERALGSFRRFGVMAVLIPSMLPPPAPLKIFVLLAGAAGITTSRFVVAMLIGRGIRYLGEGLLAYWYGEAALAFLKNNGRTVSISLTMLLLIALAGYLLWQKTRASRRQ